MKQWDMSEKHVTLDRAGSGPDDSFSLEEEGLKELCVTSNTAWESLGEIKYQRTEAGKGNLKFRRSLYFVNSLAAGVEITEKDVRSVWPGFGLAPKYYDQVIGTRESKKVEKHTSVTLDSLIINLK